MSGIDEQSKHAPECPQCGHCNEWFLGGQQWLLTEASMEKRGLVYPLVCFRKDGPDEYALSLTYRCITCSKTFSKDSIIGQELYTVFMNQKGASYHYVLGTGELSGRVYKV